MIRTGLPLVVGSWIGLLTLTVPAVVVFVALALVEDRRMAQALGASYRAYMAETARLFPGAW